MKLTSIAILTAALCLTGCTLPNATPTASNPADSGITGNWEITLTSTTWAGITYPFGIYLTQSGSTISGVGSWAGEAFPTYCPASGPCAGYPFVMLSPNFTGTVSADGNIVLATTSRSNPAVLSITASPTSSSMLAGSFAIIESAATIDQGPFAGTMIAPLSGTYAGTLISSVTGNSIGVTTTLSQTGPGASGFLAFSGSASLTDVSCIGSVTLPASGTFLGNQLSINLYPANIPGGGIYLMGTISPNAKTIAVNYESVSGGCSEDSGNGTLTLQ